MSHHGDCHVTPIVRPVDPEALREARAARLAIAGLGCERCAARVRNALLELGDAPAAEVSLADGTARVAYDPGRSDVARLLAAVAGCGDGRRHRYRATLLGVGPVRAAVAGTPS
jgi:copper chaperone CopZ